MLEMRRLRGIDRITEAKNETRGLPRYHASSPAVRKYGPIRLLVGIDGAIIGTDSNLHPFGPNRPKYRREDEDEDDGDDEDAVGDLELS